MCEKITMDKQYRTRSGLPVRILAVDVKDKNYPVLALVQRQPNQEEQLCCTKTGKYHALESGNDPLDLVEYNLAMDWEVGQPICVRDNEHEAWVMRIFMEYVEGAKTPFIVGTGPWNEAWSRTAWKEARLPTKDELKTYIRSPEKILTSN